jgi:hypothetical protein
LRLSRLLRHTRTPHFTQLRLVNNSFPKEKEIMLVGSVVRQSSNVLKSVGKVPTSAAATTTTTTDLVHSSRRRNSSSRGGNGRESESILSALFVFCFVFFSLMSSRFFSFRVESNNNRALSLNSTTKSSTSMRAIEEKNISKKQTTP